MHLDDLTDLLNSLKELVEALVGLWLVMRTIPRPGGKKWGQGGMRRGVAPVRVRSPGRGIAP